MRISPWAAAAFTLFLSAGEQAGAATLEDSLKSCRSIADPAERVQCYDALADSLASVAAADHQPANETPVTAAAPSEPDTPGPAATRPPTDVVTAAPEPAPTAAAPAATGGTPEVSGEALFGKDKSSTRSMIEEAFGVSDVNYIEATVTRVERTPHGKLMLLLDNGHIWTQIDSARLSLRPGDGVRIEGAMSGSFLLQKQSGSRKLRVKRID